MNDQTGKIQYFDKLITGIPGFTWNPVVGCSPVSAGCTNCWARSQIKRNKYFNSKVAKRYDEADRLERPVLFPERLGQPLKVKTPAMIGVCFMGDLFHDHVPFDFIEEVFDVMCQDSAWGTVGRTFRGKHDNEYPAGMKPHKFLILTKRPIRMGEFISYYKSKLCFQEAKENFLKNVWLGVSVEDQQTADERIPILLQIPAAVRWVSLEPMLEGIDLTSFLPHSEWWDSSAKCSKCGSYYGNLVNEAEWDFKTIRHACDTYEDYEFPICKKCETDTLEPLWLDWVVVGCESGAKRRPCNIEHIEMVVQQCKNSGTPCFVKQAEINGKVVKMPQIFGKVWNQLPEVK